MTLFRYSILAVTVAAAIGTAGSASAADNPAQRDPTARYCTNDPDLASDLYEYLQDCPAAQGLLNRAGQWEAVERGAVTTPGAVNDPGRPSDVGRSGTMKTPDTTGQGSTVRKPNAPGDPTGTAKTTPSAPGGAPMGTPGAPGGAPMGTPSAPSGGGTAN